MSVITSANAPNAIVKLVASQALPALLSNLVMGNLVNRQYEPMLQEQGDTVNVAIPPVMVANSILETGSVQPQNPNLGNAQIVLNTHIEATFQVGDILKALSSVDILATYMRPAVIAIATRIESDLLGQYVNFTANAALGTAGTAATEAVIDSAETALFSSLVPPNDQLNLVVNPGTYSALRQIERFSEMRMNGELGADAINSGTVLKAKGLTVFRSQNVIQTGSSPVATHNIAFHRDALGLIVRRLPTAIPGTGAIQEFVSQSGFGMRITLAYIPGQLAQQFTVDCLYGVAVLRNQFAVRVEA